MHRDLPNLNELTNNLAKEEGRLTKDPVVLQSIISAHRQLVRDFDKFKGPATLMLNWKSFMKAYSDAVIDS